MSENGKGLVEVFGDVSPGDQIAVRGTDELRVGTRDLRRPRAFRLRRNECRGWQDGCRPRPLTAFFPWGSPRGRSIIPQPWSGSLQLSF